MQVWSTQIPPLQTVPKSMKIKLNIKETSSLCRILYLTSFGKERDAMIELQPILVGKSERPQIDE
jgi:hypothetical protein